MHSDPENETVESANRLLSRGEVASIYGISKRWLEVASSKGQGPPVVKITSKMVRYRASDVDAWIESLVDYGPEGSLLHVRQGDR
ncbi:helix-turn-helix transcriptional regulator [Cribrihabitans marinus]|uniref:helix-turn-helix transcriptional regulator n=1 Tax=Cribrihabitans marinus TaxID=1227549 RepID=UPI000B881CFF|nr:helix-turn-helix domain-containing protein [Cribrihabitans marinus]GGH41555.1 hypothetical protein GCM10010973_38550 [Cribrihabitans marinus]